ncbi:hypothetical protein [Methylobacterium frigidaeris]|uniref:Cytochrome c domain-containing protein n=1 Tax=Methylobacterium frigidaeris TaxID=2038277 RepID=A0AA37HI11_9HYPH|nr:hypothetical protein [Methylobacterium frigidaeris]GJD66492.1 hypothetical protein MPEAHAMD_6690 [Methylobacterium frigidaeris]
MLRQYLLIGIAILCCGLAPGQVSAQAYTINDHGKDCAREIGPIPPFSCLDGEIIPITRDGAPISDNAHVPHQKCDRPPLLGLGGSDGQCVPFSRLGTLPGKTASGQDDPNLQWTFICRRYRVRTDKNYPLFEDVAVIGHNKASGATCFFQTLSSGTSDGIKATRVPPPAEDALATPPGEIKAADFWLSPQDTANIKCNKCHDNDAFIHTPHVSQVRRMVGGQSVEVVPPGPNLKANPPEPSRYKFIGQPFEQDWPAPKRIRPLGNLCTSCHNIGTLDSCNRFTKLATGRTLPTNISDLGKTFPHSHWMPPDNASTGITLAQWKALYDASVDKILACCAAPGTLSCKMQGFDH